MYGTSPYRYSLVRRLGHARRDLHRGTPLAVAAANAGFADLAHFTRMFRATFGMPPGRYAHYWNSDSGMSGSTPSSRNRET
jgi:AraC-like DNA-binding protein